MAAPAFGSIGTRLSANTSTPAPAVPASVAADDIIVVYLYTPGAGTTITARPAGFAAVEGSPIINAGGVAAALHIEWKRATGADTGTYSFTISAAGQLLARAARYTGAITTGNPWDTPTAKADSSPTSVTTAPAVSITTAGSDRLLLYASSMDNGNANTWTAPSGFTEREGGASVTKIEASDKVQAAGGGSGTAQASNPASFSTMNAWLGALIGTTVDAPRPMAQPQAMFPLFAGSPLPMPFQAPVFDAQLPAVAAAVPSFPAQPAGRIRRPSPTRLRRAGQPTPAPTVGPPDLTPGAAPVRLHVWMRRRARLSVPPPVQAVPVDSDQLQRPRRRPGLLRSRSAQPVLVQIVAPTNPVLVPAGMVHRAKAVLRRSRTAQPVAPQFNPPLVPQPLGHRLRVVFRRPRPAAVVGLQPVPADLDYSRRRLSTPRVRSRAAQVVPPQFNPPLAPQTLGHRIRVAVRRPRVVTLPAAQVAPPDLDQQRRRPIVRPTRSRSAQPPPTQAAAPTNPPWVPLVLARRAKAAVLRSRDAQPIPPQFNPPIVLQPLPHRLRTGFRRPRPTGAPQDAQQPPTGPSTQLRLVRPRRGATASPTPTQAAAPTNPAWVPSLLRKVRPVLRRGGGRSASPTPAQQTVIPNPPFVFVDVRKVRGLFLRRSKTAATVPTQRFPEVPNRAGVTPGLRARRGRTAQPPIIQTQPPTPAGIQNRQRRRLLVWQRRGRDAWRELGQAVAPVVEFFQGVLTGGVRPGPSATGGVGIGPASYGGAVSGTSVTGVLQSGATAAGTVQAGPTVAGIVRSGATVTGQDANSNLSGHDTASKVTGAATSGGQTVGHGLLGTLDFYGDLYSDIYLGGEGTVPLGVTGEQQDSNLTGGSR